MSTKSPPISMDDEGATIDAAILAEGLGIEAAEIDRLIREGRLTSSFEKGIGADEGKSRLTFWIEGKRLRVVVDDRGTILQRFRINFGALRRP